MLSPTQIRRLTVAAPVFLCLTVGVPPGFLRPPSSVLLAALQYLLAVSGLYLAVSARGGEKGSRGIRRLHSIPGHLVLFSAAGILVGHVYPHWPLVPILFLILFPVSVFARRPGFFWVPAAVLTVAAAGRYLFLGETGLFHWSGAFLLFSALLGMIMAKDQETIIRTRTNLKRIETDARETMDRVRREGLAEEGKRIRGEDAAKAVTQEEKALLNELLKWGCRSFGARNGIILVPHESNSFRVWAAVERRARIINEDIPSEKGFIHLARERGGVLYLSDARSAAPSLGLYPEGTVVGSLLAKVVYDARWARDLSDGTGSGKISCVLYFDSDAPDAFAGESVVSRQLEEFGSLVGQIREVFGTLQRIMKDISGKYAINRYARDLTLYMNPAKIIEKALETVQETIPECDGALVLLESGNGLVIGNKVGESVRDLEFVRITSEEPSQIGLLLRGFMEKEGGLGAESTRSGIVISQEKTRSSPLFLRGEKLGKAMSFAAIPSSVLAEDGRTILKAVIVVLSRKKKSFSSEEVEDLRTLARMMAPALDNAQNHLKVDELSRTDGLTGLLNLRAFLIILEGKMTRIRRGYDAGLAVIMVDGDHFKMVNDTHGHPVGDEVLVELARRLKTPLRKGDAVARYGGEEFTIALDEVNEKITRKIAEKIRRDIESRPFKTAAGPLTFTASFGFCVIKDGSSLTREEFLARADRALYHAKETGRNRVVGFSEIEKDRSSQGKILNSRIPVEPREEKRW
ncbi:MAG: sensor domain-containing diguanylate cyclase [Proteobacteria bacterium]|nr:sensor domain-containing diguanylate cyclase [Pseudomonadota bacterium]